MSKLQLVGSHSHKPATTVTMTTFCLKYAANACFLLLPIGELQACDKSPKAVRWKSTTQPFTKEQTQDKEPQQAQLVASSLHC